MPSPAPDRHRRPGLSAAERLHRLIEWLRSSQPLTTPRAAETFGVSRRTITRDLAYLREELSLTVTFDPAQNSYVLEEEQVVLPFLAHPDLTPSLIEARLPSTLPRDEADHPPVCVRFSTRAVQVFAATSELDLDDETNEDGTLDVHFAPPDLGEFISWILSCGCDAEVRKPRELRKRVHVEIRRMLSVYAKEPGVGA